VGEVKRARFEYKSIRRQRGIVRLVFAQREGAAKTQKIIAMFYRKIIAPRDGAVG
jgi:hypothetical protein